MLAILAAGLLAAPPPVSPVRKLDLQLRSLPALPAPPPRKPVAQRPAAPKLAPQTPQSSSSPVRCLALAGSILAAQVLGFRDETPPFAAGIHFLGGSEAATTDVRPH